MRLMAADAKSHILGSSTRKSIKVGYDEHFNTYIK